MVSFWGDFGLVPEWGRRRGLSFRLSIDSVVEDYLGDVWVSSRRVRNMPAPNCEGVTVTRNAYDAEFWVGDVDSLCNWENPSMKRVNTIGLEIVWKASVASNS